MSYVDPDDRPPASLEYATEKIVFTVDQIATSDGPLPMRLRLAWIDQGERAYPPGDDIPEGCATAIREINARLTDVAGQTIGPATQLDAEEITRRLVVLACALNAAKALGGGLYYGEGEV